MKGGLNHLGRESIAAAGQGPAFNVRQTRQEGARQNIESAGYKFDALFTTSDLGI